MTEWSPTRRELFGVLGGVPAAGVGNVSWENATDVVPTHPFVPEADTRWTKDVGSTAFITESVSEETLYVRTETAVVALSLDGDERWRFEMPGQEGDEKYSLDMHHESGTVYVDDDETVWALAADDGTIRWKFDGERHASISNATPETAFVSAEGLVALTASDGHERWRFDPEGGVWLRPFVADGTVYVGTTQGDFYALFEGDGTVDWHVELPEIDGNEYTSNYPSIVPAGATHDVALAWDSNETTLYAFDTTDGSLRWQFEATIEDRVSFPGTVERGVVYLNDGSTLHAISARDGTEKWQFDAGSELEWSALLVDETAYVGSRTDVYAVSLDDGRQRWKSGAGNLVAGVSDDTLVVQNQHRTIYGLSLDEGAVRWKHVPDGELAWFPQVTDEGVYFGTKPGVVGAISEPGSTPLYDVLRTATSPIGLLTGGLLGTALVVGTYRNRTRTDMKAATADTTNSATTVEDFEIREKITETPQTEVHEARTPDSERVVLKRITDGITPEEFASAVETWADLDCAGVLDVRQWGTDPVPWVATEYADASLADRAPDIPVSGLVNAVADAAEAVHRAHSEGVSHGRLTAENVLFVDGDVRVADWRLAADLRDPPEWQADPAETDPKSADTYQLAALAADLIAGEQVGDDSEASDELGDVLTRALADDPADRYDSALAFADALRWAVRD